MLGFSSEIARRLFHAFKRALCLWLCLLAANIPLLAGDDMTLCPVEKNRHCQNSASAAMSQLNWTVDKNPFEYTWRLTVSSPASRRCPNPPCLLGGLINVQFKRKGGDSFCRAVNVPAMNNADINSNQYKDFSLWVFDDVTPHWTPGTYKAKVTFQKFRWWPTDPDPVNPCATLVLNAQSRIKVQPGAREHLNFEVTNQSSKNLRDVVIRLNVEGARAERHGGGGEMSRSLQVSLQKNETKRLAIGFLAPHFRHGFKYEATLRADAYRKHAITATAIDRIKLIPSFGWLGH